MGFNKRFISREIIEMTEDRYIKNLFSADALLFSDEWSNEFYNLFKEGYKYNEILKKLN